MNFLFLVENNNSKSRKNKNVTAALHHSKSLKYLSKRMEIINSEIKIVCRKAEVNFSKIFSVSLRTRNFKTIKIRVKIPKRLKNKEIKRIAEAKSPPSTGSMRKKKMRKMIKKRKVEKKIREREDFIDITLYYTNYFYNCLSSQISLKSQFRHFQGFGVAKKSLFIIFSIIAMIFSLKLAKLSSKSSIVKGWLASI